MKNVVGGKVSSGAGSSFKKWLSGKGEQFEELARKIPEPAEVVFDGNRFMMHFSQEMRGKLNAEDALAKGVEVVFAQCVKGEYRVDKGIKILEIKEGVCVDLHNANKTVEMIKKQSKLVADPAKNPVSVKKIEVHGETILKGEVDVKLKLGSKKIRTGKDKSPQLHALLNATTIEWE